MNPSGAKDKDDHNHDQDDEMSDINLSELVDDSVLELMDKRYNPNITARLRTDYKYNGFDSSLGNSWIYPTNYPIRQYQFNISRISLFKNTLVTILDYIKETLFDCHLHCCCRLFCLLDWEKHS